MNSKIMMGLAGVMLLGAVVAGYLGFKASAQSQQVASLSEAAVPAAGADGQRGAGKDGRYGVVVAAKDLPEHEPVKAEDVYIEYLRQAPPGSYAQIESVVGKRPYMPVTAGGVLTEASMQAGGVLARLVKPGERALAIAVDEVVGGGGFVRPGDRVDVLLFTREQNSNGQDRSAAQVVLSDMRVVSYGIRIAETDHDASRQKDEKKPEDTTVARTAVLAIPEQDISRLLLASNLGVLRLAVRSVEEPAAVAVAKAEGTAKDSGAKVQADTRQLVMASSLLPEAARPMVQVVQRPAVVRSAPEPRHSVILQRGSSVQQVAP